MTFESTRHKGNVVKGKLKSQKELKKITGSKKYKDSDYEGKTKMLNKATYRAGGRVNTRRMNRLEELGRVDAEKAFTKKGARNLRDEKKRIVRELKADGGKVKKKKPIRKISFNAMIEAVKEKNRNPMKDQRLDDSIKGKTVRFIEDEKKAKGGKVGGLKKVQPSQKGLKKLPTKVRNKMGYMKKGGRVGMGKAMRGGGCVR